MPFFYKQKFIDGVLGVLKPKQYNVTNCLGFVVDQITTLK